MIEKRLQHPGRVLRGLLKSDLVVAPGVWDAITAKLAEAAGAQALYLTGAGVTNGLTGYPDIALLTLPEMARQATYVCDAVRVPVFADADTGYGETLNVMRAVREFERAGLAGMHLEDQLSPKKCGHLSGKRLIDASSMVGKLRAALAAREDPSFYIIARTDARGVEGLEGAIERGKRYVDAGADCVFPEGLESVEEFGRFRSEVSGDLLANMTEFGKTPLIPVSQFRSLGYNLVIFPMTAFRVMMRSVGKAYQTLLEEGTQVNLLTGMRNRKELYELIRYKDYEDLDRRISEEADVEGE